MGSTRIMETTPIDTTTPAPAPAPAPKSDMLGRKLTAREQEILAELASGHTNVKTGEALKISVKTVEAHRARLFKKLGANNAPQAIVFAFAQGFLKAPLSAYTNEELVAELATRRQGAVAAAVAPITPAT